MEVKKYLYSPYQTWFAVIMVFGFVCFGLYGIIKDYPNDDVWTLFVPFILICSVALVYICREFFLPLLLGGTILELDKEKLQYFVRNKTIYWNDVDRIEYVIGAKSGSWSIRFVMKDKSGVKRISTKYIAGNDKEIYDTIVEFFEKYK